MAKVQVEIKDMAFNPATVSIKAGDCVCWTNNDSMAHTVTDDAAAKRKAVDSGKIEVGASYERTYATAGSFPYHCEYHSGMNGCVEVS